jgi:CRP-like cAMP-binding protein
VIGDLCLVRADLLQKVPLLTLLSERDRRKIASEVTEAHYGKGEYIFREGDPADYFHIVKEGTVKCVKSSSDGKECTLKALLPVGLSSSSRTHSTLYDC